MAGKPGAPEIGNAADHERYFRDMQAYYKDPSGWGVLPKDRPFPLRCKCGRDNYLVHGFPRHLEDNTPAGNDCKKGDKVGPSPLHPPETTDKGAPKVK